MHSLHRLTFKVNNDNSWAWIFFQALSKIAKAKMWYKFGCCKPEPFSKTIKALGTIVWLNAIIICEIIFPLNMVSF